MNWDALGAIGEIAGAIGVVVTLVYLSTQIRQNTKSSKITAVQSAVEGSARWNEILVNDKELGEMFWRGMANPELLEAGEKLQFVGVLNIFMRRESLSFYLHKEGTMPQELWESRVRGLSGILNQPGTRLFMDVGADTLPDDYRDFLESIISKGSTMSETARQIFTEVNK
jgi:hypothetical protein